MKIKPVKILRILLLFTVAACTSVGSYDYKYEYTWKDSDTIPEIAKKFNVDTIELRRVNDIYEPEDLYEGKVLRIPREPSGLIKNPLPPSLNSRNVRFRWPSPGTISSKFGKRWGRFHYGIDLRSNRGKEILAAEGGIVKFAGAQNGFGKVVIIQHSKAYETLYAHNEKIFVTKGQKVTRGTVISKMGRTGRVTGVHLHFEVHKNGKPINPLQVLPKRTSG